MKYQVSDEEPRTRVIFPQVVIKVTATQRIWSAAWSKKVIKLFINKITLAANTISQNHSSFRFRVRSCPYCKLRQFVNIYLPILQGFQPSAICPVLVSIAPKCMWWPGCARTSWGSLQRSPRLRSWSN